MNNDGKLLDSIQNLTDVDLKALVRWLSRTTIQAVRTAGLDAGPARTINAVVQLLTDEHERRRVEMAQPEATAGDDPVRGLSVTRCGRSVTSGMAFQGHSSKASVA